MEGAGDGEDRTTQALMFVCTFAYSSWLDEPERLRRKHRGMMNTQLRLFQADDA